MYTLITPFLFQSTVVRALITLIITGLLCFITGIFYRKYTQKLKQNPHVLNAVLLEALYKPLVVFILGVGLVYALEWLCVDWKEQRSLLLLIRHLIFTVILAWFLWRFVSLYGQVFLKQVQYRKTIDKALVHALIRIAKVVIIIMTALFLFQLFGLSITGVLAFGGVGGVVVGFAAKDLLANLFGSLMLFLGGPFVIGDQISVPALKIEGTVEEIGWRMCRIQTPECRPVYIPNALFSNLVVENLSRIKARRFYCKINLSYQDLAKIPTVLKEMRDLLKAHSAIDQSRPITVSLDELDISSLNLLIVAYLGAVSSADFLMIKEALYLKLLACLPHQGIQWAFPAHNVYFINSNKIG